MITVLNKFVAADQRLMQYVTQLEEADTSCFPGAKTEIIVDLFPGKAPDQLPPFSAEMEVLSVARFEDGRIYHMMQVVSDENRTYRVTAEPIPRHPMAKVH